MANRLTAEEKADREIHKNMHYVRMDTLPKTIPEGRVLRHNHVKHGPGTTCGVNGFRAWTYPGVMDGFVNCPCTWSGLPHYVAKGHVAVYRKDGRLRSTGEFSQAWNGDNIDGMDDDGDD
jgi:hypothetical protein